MSAEVVVKLTNGDMFMATLLKESDEAFLFQDPVAIKTVQVVGEGGVIEKTVTHPFCTLTHEREFAFDRSVILFCKALSPKIASYYVRLTAAFLDEKNEDNEFGQTSFDRDDSSDEQDDDYVDQDDDDHDSKVFLILPDTKTIH